MSVDMVVINHLLQGSYGFKIRRPHCLDFGEVLGRSFKAYWGP